jgi:hypothetical protein
MDLWNEETPIADLDTDITIPAWIEQDITPHDVAAIYQGGCASGAYMPAVRYFDADATMAKHGDDVTQYIEDAYGELPQPPADSSWSGIADDYIHNSCLHARRMASRNRYRARYPTQPKTRRNHSSNRCRRKRQHAGYASRTGANRQKYSVGGVAAREIGKIKNLSACEIINI